MLDSRRLRLVVEIDRTGSFSAAAQSLSFTPSAVSQQVGALERELGAVLFERGARGVRLTEAGQVLVRHARAVLARLEDAEAELAALVGRRGGHVRLGSFPTATSAFTARALERFRSLHPEVHVSFTDGEPYESLVRLRARDLDLALVFDFERWRAGTDYAGAVRCPDDEMTFVDLFDDPFMLVVARDRPLAASAVISPSAIVDERIYAYAPWAADLRHVCHAAGFEPHLDPAYHATDFQAFQALAATGRGVTFVPRLSLTAVRDDVVVIPMEPGFVRHVRVAMPRDAYLTPAAGALLDVIRDLAPAEDRSP